MTRKVKELAIGGCVEEDLYRDAISRYNSTTYW